MAGLGHGVRGIGVLALMLLVFMLAYAAPGLAAPLEFPIFSEASHCLPALAAGLGCGEAITSVPWMDGAALSVESLNFGGLPAEVAHVARDSVAPIPLPAAAWLLLSGIGGLGLLRRRRGLAQAVPLRAALLDSGRAVVPVRISVPRSLGDWSRRSAALLRRPSGPVVRPRPAPARLHGAAGWRYAPTAERAPPAAVGLAPVQGRGIAFDGADQALSGAFCVPGSGRKGGGVVTHAAKGWGSAVHEGVSTNATLN